MKTIDAFPDTPNSFETGLHYVAQAGLKDCYPPGSASQVVQYGACATTPTSHPYHIILISDNVSDLSTKCIHTGNLRLTKKCLQFMQSLSYYNLNGMICHYMFYFKSFVQLFFQ